MLFPNFIEKGNLALGEDSFMNENFIPEDFLKLYNFQTNNPFNHNF